MKKKKRFFRDFSLFFFDCVFHENMLKNILYLVFLSRFLIEKKIKKNGENY